MTDEEKKILLEVKAQTEHLAKQTKELIYALTGGKGTIGLIERIKVAEHARELQQERDEKYREEQRRDAEAFRAWEFKMLDDIESNLTRKIENFFTEANHRFEDLDKFKKELSDFKQRLEIYMNILTSKTTWLFLVKLTTGIIIIGSILIAFYKGGYEVLAKIFKEFKNR